MVQFISERTLMDYLRWKGPRRLLGRAVGFFAAGEKGTTPEEIKVRFPPLLFRPRAIFKLRSDTPGGQAS